MENKKKKNLIIGGLIALVLIMAVGYAAFATNLNINGTTSIDSRWDVKILSITPDKTATNTGTEQAPVYTTPGDIAHSITNNSLTANFSTALVSPGDAVTYEVVVKNNGTLNAKLSSMTTTDTNNPAISFTTSGIAENDVLEANASKTITIVVTYVNNENGQGQPASTTSELGITLNFVQTNDSAAPATPQTPSTYTGDVYAWNTTSITVGTSTINNLVSTKTTNPYYTSEADIQSALSGKTNSTMYNKYTVEGDTITEGYACQTYGILSQAVCLKMSTNGSEYGYDAGGNHTKNAGILKALQSNTTFTGASGSCSFNSDVSRCNVGDLRLFANSSGYVYAFNYDTDARCSVFDSGSAFCHES